MMGELLTTMVANDAFTQALTNPLLARNVFNEETFSPVGLSIINETGSLQQIIARNSSLAGVGGVQLLLLRGAPVCGWSRQARPTGAGLSARTR